MRGGGLARELLERDQRVVAAAQPIGALLDEVADERPVLVERGPVLADVLLEGERERLACVVELAQEVGERAERERAQGVMELRRAGGHEDRYPTAAHDPCPGRAGRLRARAGSPRTSTRCGSCSPRPRERIGAPQRGQAGPARR